VKTENDDDVEEGFGRRKKERKREGNLYLRCSNSLDLILEWKHLNLDLILRLEDLLGALRIFEREVEMWWWFRPKMGEKEESFGFIS